MDKKTLHMEDTVEIDAPIKTVFEFIADFKNTPKWHKNMKKVGWKKEGPYGVGSEYDWIETFFGMKMDIGGVITSWNPPYSFTWKPTTSPFPITGGWTLLEKGNSTFVTRYSDNQLSGIYKWMNLMMVPVAKRQVRKELQELKRLIEVSINL
ncbi:MAG: SRPBCC family protein [Chitinophagaceae bacterium]|nr:SRPBCC family protein [Saprospiraceae bacterium]MBP9104379.1 SRPBCC family protein [Chitinophagaceae bacterium]